MSAAAEIRSLSQALFRMAKGASGLAFVGETAALVLGAWMAFMRAPEWTSITVLAILALITFYLRGVADDWKERANEQLCVLDLADGLGRPIPHRERADILAEAPAPARWLARRQDGAGAYFASPKPGSPLRLVENLRESAWWTSHLSRTAESLQRVWITLFGLLGVGTLAMEAVRGVTPSTFLMNPSFAIAMLLFLFTSGPYRRLGEFRALHDAAAKVETEAGHLLEHPERIVESQALLLAARYHLARKGAPLLPGFVWRLRRATLNPLWDAVVHEQAGPASA